MIEQNSNVLKDPKIKRIVQYSEDYKQINILDQRFYQKDGKYYPSVSSILNYFPKNQYFYGWLKDTGHASEIIAAKAAYEGTQVHKAIENFLEGHEVKWIDEFGTAIYNLEVWKMILKFTEFWNKYKPELISSEYHVFSDTHEYAGTIDLILKLNEKLWLVDIKTSNSLHTSHNLQLAAYVNAWNETHSDPIECMGIIWLKSSVRTEGKGDKIQGKGWELKRIDNFVDNFKMFQNIQEIYKLENPDSKPYTSIIPISVKLEV